MKVIDKRNNEDLLQFYKVKIGDGFDWNGKPYIKTSDDYIFNLLEIREEEVEDASMIVSPLNITITIEK